MATKTANTPKTATKKGKKPASAGSSTRKKSSAKRPAASAAKGRSREQPRRTRSARDGAHTHGRREIVAPHAARVLHGHRRDIWGIALVALGLLTGLGVYVDAAGPIGNGISQFFGGVVGLLRVALPVVFIAIGLVLIRGHLRRQPAMGTTGDLGEPIEVIEDVDQGTRLALGGMVSVIASAGLLHLWAGQPEWSDSVDEFVDAGGFLGWMVGAPLHAAFRSIGSAIILLAFLVIGFVVITAMSVAMWWGAGARRMDALGGTFARWWSRITGIDAQPAIYQGDDILLEDPSAPIIVGGQQVGEYRRGEASGPKRKGRRAANRAASGEAGDPLLADKTSAPASSFSEHQRVVF